MNILISYGRMIFGVLIVRIYGVFYLRIGVGRRVCVCIVFFNMVNVVYRGFDGGSTGINCYFTFCIGVLKLVKNFLDFGNLFSLGY